LNLDSKWYLTEDGLYYLDETAEIPLEETSNAEMVLEILTRRGPNSIRQLASHFDIPTKSMASVLSSMYAKGYIEPSYSFDIAPYTMKSSLFNPRSINRTIRYANQERDVSGSTESIGVTYEPDSYIGSLN